MLKLLRSVMGNPRKSSARRKKHQARLHKGPDSAVQQCSTQSTQPLLGSYPFLDHNESREYLKKTKVMFIMRGLPGSGKSSIVDAISATYRRSEVCSTDEHFKQEDGTYEFNRDLLPTFHASNQDKARRACTQGVPTVIIDNTNVKRWELVPYAQMALQHDYLAVPVLPQTPWALTPALLAAKNKHGVAEEVLEAKLKDFLELQPSFYGWFMNAAVSRELKDMARSYFDMCRAQQGGIPGFMKSLGIAADKQGAPFPRLYARDGVLHCTASYIGKKPTPASEEYINSERVKQAWLNLYPLRIIGLIITPRTVGARVELNKQEIALWQNDPVRDPSPQQIHATLNAAAPFKPFLGNHMATKHDFEPMRGKHAPPKAHITLGCAEGVSAVETGPDLLKLVALEAKYAHVKDRYFELPYGDSLLGEGARVRYYGPDNGYVIYFDKPIVRKSIFNFRY